MELNNKLNKKSLIPLKNKKSVKYRNLVLEGGGILGISYCGALEELHKRGLLSGIKNFAGSSAGSIIAGALACGATFNFIMKELTEVDFNSFMDYGNKLRAVYNLYYYNGICPGDAFINWYGGVIEKLTGDANITLLQIHEKYGGRLVITSTSTNTRKVVYFDYRSHPDLQLKLAVRMSTSIPFIFIPVNYAGDTWVDGGVLDNYPIRAFHKETLTDDRINPKTIGLMLMTAMEDKANYPPVTGFWSFVESLLGCYMTQTQKMYMDPQDWARTIKIPCGNISSFNFSISAEAKEELINAGKIAVINHFDNDRVITQQNYLLQTESIHTGHKSEDDETPSTSPEITMPIDIPKHPSDERLNEKILSAPVPNNEHEYKPYKSTPPIDIPYVRR